MIAKNKITKEEFEYGYAQRSGLTVDELHTLGLRAEPCDCGADNCRGWKMVPMVEQRALFMPFKNQIVQEEYQHNWYLRKKAGLPTKTKPILSPEEKLLRKLKLKRVQDKLIRQKKINL